MQSKKALEIALSKLLGFENPKVRNEQYLTPSSVASEVLWKANIVGDIDEKIVADFGSGTGILGLGCALLGAKKVFLVEKDAEAIKISKENLENLRREYDLNEVVIVEKDVEEFSEDVDLIIMNPPFGTREKHADRMFLEKALSTTNLIYSFHKTSTLEYLKAFIEKRKFRINEQFNFSFLLKQTMAHHTKKKQYIDVSCIRIVPWE